MRSAIRTFRCSIAFLVQQAIAWACLKSDRFRGFLCGTPQYLIRGGVLQESVMRRTNYAIRDLVEHLRQKDVFDLADVEDAILESNGSLSVRLRHEGQPPSRKDLDLPTQREQPPELLMREGKILPEGLRAAKLDEKTFAGLLSARQLAPENVFVAQRQTDGTIRIQTRDARIVTIREA